MTSTLDFGEAIDSLSCTASSFCAAGDAPGKTYTYSGSWSAATILDSGEAAARRLLRTPATRSERSPRRH